jgi:hypothetical protein
MLLGSPFAFFGALFEGLWRTLGHLVELGQFVVELFVEEVANFAVEVVQAAGELLLEFAQLLFDALLDFAPALQELPSDQIPVFGDFVFELEQVLEAELSVDFGVQWVGFQEAVAAPDLP